MPDDIVQQLRDAACGNDCHCHYCERNKAAANEIERLRAERDEARNVMHSIVEEFVQHGQPSHPRYQPTPMHQCEFQYAPEYGKCHACEAWSEYVRICHPTTDTEKEKAP